MNARHGAVAHRPRPGWTARRDAARSQITLGRLVITGGDDDGVDDDDLIPA